MSKIAFRERGQGQVLILLHGYAGSVLHWDKVADILATSFKVVVPNLSHLSMGKENLTFTQQVDLIAEFIRHQYPNQAVHLAGISFGGALSWGLSTKYPDLISKVVLINPMPPFPVNSFSLKSLKIFFALPLHLGSIYFFLKSPIGKRFLKQTGEVFRNLRGDQEEERIDSLHGRKLQFVTHLLYKFAWILKTERWHTWENKLEFWAHDCLLIYDVQDPLFHVDFYKSFAEILACENIVLTKNAGHISIVQESGLVGRSIREFLLRGNTGYQEPSGMAM